MNPGETHQALTEFSVIQNWPYMALKVLRMVVVLSRILKGSFEIRPRSPYDIKVEK